MRTMITQALSESRALSKRLEEAHNQLLQSEKLAAIGQLAAGVAHELNNPIGFVHSNLGTLGEYSTALIEICDAYTTLIEDQHPDCPQLEQIRRIKELQDYNFLRADIFPLLEESREGLNRVRKIVQDLRDFSRAGKHDWDFADLHKGLDSTLNILANELKYKCTVRKAYGSIPEVRCAISQINQVFMNLLINAAQAIETTGEIVISSGNRGTRPGLDQHP
jgi:signal transduction histidine kinase